LTEQLIAKLGYLGIALILILGGLGLPIPEEAPIIVAAVLSRNGKLNWPLALGSCLSGVLLGDLVVYFLGFFYGEKVLSLPVTRRLLTRQRETQIKGYFHRHGFKILVSGRFVPGFRTAAYLTAGILKLPALKLVLTDLVAASLSTVFFFGLGYAFAYQIQQGIREVQQWILVGVAVAVVTWLLIRYYRAKRRAGQPVGPPVLEDDLDPLSIDTMPGAQVQQSASSKSGTIAAAKPERVELSPADDEQSPPSPDGLGLTDSSARHLVESPSNQNHDGIALDSAMERSPDAQRSPKEQFGVGRS
jgi:membrane protein DedA with SNARE-associated domain